MFDVKKVQEEAQKEVHEERMKAVKEKLKTKMRDLEKARQVVRTLEREIELFLVEIGE